MISHWRGRLKSIDATYKIGQKYGAHACREMWNMRNWTAEKSALRLVELGGPPAVAEVNLRLPALQFWSMKIRFTPTSLRRKGCFPIFQFSGPVWHLTIAEFQKMAEQKKIEALNANNANNVGGGPGGGPPGGPPGGPGGPMDPHGMPKQTVRRRVASGKCESFARRPARYLWIIWEWSIMLMSQCDDGVHFVPLAASPCERDHTTKKGNLCRLRTFAMCDWESWGEGFVSQQDREREREREKGEKIGALLSREPICRVGRRAGLPHGTERKEGRKEGRRQNRLMPAVNYSKCVEEGETRTGPGSGEAREGGRVFGPS